MTLTHPQPFGVLVHERREGVFRSGNRLGERNRRVIAALHDHALDQHFDRDSRVQVEVRARAFRAPSALADRNLGVELELPILERMEHGVGGHQLRDARGLDRVGRAMPGEHLAALLVHEDPGGRLE